MKNRLQIQVGSSKITYTVSIGANNGVIFYWFVPSSSKDIILLSEEFEKDSTIGEHGEKAVGIHLKTKGMSVKLDSGYKGTGVMFMIDDETVTRQLLKPIL